MDKLSADHAENNPNITGMDFAGAKEYIFGFLSTLKLTEKQIQNLDIELTKWNNRVNLAKSSGYPELVQEAEKEVERIKIKRQHLAMEADELKAQLEEMMRQLPKLSAYERSIDTDLLEQQLLIAIGYLPGEEGKVRNERLFLEMEGEAALSELKKKLEG